MKLLDLISKINFENLIVNSNSKSENINKTENENQLCHCYECGF